MKREIHMKKFLKGNKIFKFTMFLVVCAYASITFMNQQKTLDAYKNEQKYYQEQIESQEEYKKTLVSIKENINSPEYIEKIAREKLDMYLANERIYIDVGK